MSGQLEYDPIPVGKSVMLIAAPRTLIEPLKRSKHGDRVILCEAGQFRGVKEKNIAALCVYVNGREGETRKYGDIEMAAAQKDLIFCDGDEIALGLSLRRLFDDETLFPSLETSRNNPTGEPSMPSAEGGSVRYPVKLKPDQKIIVIGGNADDNKAFSQRLNVSLKATHGFHGGKIGPNIGAMVVLRYAIPKDDDFNRVFGAGRSVLKDNCQPVDSLSQAVADVNALTEGREARDLTWPTPGFAVEAKRVEPISGPSDAEDAPQGSSSPAPAQETNGAIASPSNNQQVEGPAGNSGSSADVEAKGGPSERLTTAPEMDLREYVRSEGLNLEAKSVGEWMAELFPKVQNQILRLNRKVKYSNNGRELDEDLRVLFREQVVASRTAARSISLPAAQPASPINGAAVVPSSGSASNTGSAEPFVSEDEKNRPILQRLMAENDTDPTEALGVVVERIGGVVLRDKLDLKWFSAARVRTSLRHKREREATAHQDIPPTTGNDPAPTDPLPVADTPKPAPASAVVAGPVEVIPLGTFHATPVALDAEVAAISADPPASPVVVITSFADLVAATSSQSDVESAPSDTVAKEPIVAAAESEPTLTANDLYLQLQRLIAETNQSLLDFRHQQDAKLVEVMTLARDLFAQQQRDLTEAQSGTAAEVVQLKAENKKLRDKLDLARNALSVLNNLD